MERKIAELLASKTIDVVHDGNMQKAVLAYGYELIITSLLGVFLLVALSFAIGFPGAWFPFVLGFAPLRTTAGGYHAPTHLRCYITTAAIFACSLAVAKYVVSSYVHLLIIAAITGAIILAFAPVAANNKPLSEARRARNRKRSIAISVILFAVSVILCLTRYSDFYIALYFVGSLAASVSLVVAKVLNLSWKGESL